MPVRTLQPRTRRACKPPCAAIVLTGVAIACAAALGTTPGTARAQTPVIVAQAQAPVPALKSFDAFWEGTAILSTGGDAQVALAITPRADGGLDVYARWLAAPLRRDVPQQVEIVTDEFRLDSVGAGRWAGSPRLSPLEGVVIWAVLIGDRLTFEQVAVRDDGRMLRRTFDLRLRTDGRLTIAYQRRVDDLPDVLATAVLSRRP